MLSSLFIQNFALIDSIEIEFQNGLTVITGETGAGKSVLLGALSLILGNRADHSSLHDQSRKCIVEGVFNIKNYELEAFFNEHDLDYSDRSILRREINPSGKSRSFINDTPVTLEILKTLGWQLIDIHSQHQSLQINNSDFQLDIIDAFASNDELKRSYHNVYKDYQVISSKLSMLKNKAIGAKKQEDYLNFQYKELEDLNLTKGEASELEIEQQRFANSEDILLNLSRLNQALSEGEENVLGQMQAIKQLFDQNRDYPELVELKQRFSSVLIELQDISSEVEMQPNKFQYEPERHQIVEERLAEIHRLQQKHQVVNADELIDLHSQIAQQLESISNYEAEIARLEKEQKILNLDLREKAEELSVRRLEVLKTLEIQIQEILYLLGIPHANLTIHHQKKQELNHSGFDEFNFLFSANKGIEPQQISKIASGGEISRLMLSIKSILARHKQMPTILFDEIDTGVSGEIAEKMGSILADIGSQRQVISITHLPQIAAKGLNHFYVYKEEGGNTSKTMIKKLNHTERVEELAKMLSGKNLTNAAINNAKELLAQ